MFEKILVPLDGSPLAEKALPYAAFLAQASGGSIALVRAVETRSFSPHDQAEEVLDAKPLAERDLAGVADRLRAQGLAVELRVEAGEAAGVIHGAAEAAGADLIAMSTHGRSGLARWAYGSVAERVLRTGGRPVLLVPAHCEQAWEARTPTSIIVPLDGSSLAEEALDLARPLARTLSATLMLVQAIEPPPATAYDGLAFTYLDVENWVEQAKPYAEGVAERLRSEGLTASALTLPGYAAATIASQAEFRHAAAIVMATHGRTGLARVLGSVAQGVVQRATMPVLVTRPQVLVQPQAAAAPATARA